MDRNIWICWLQGWDNAPIVVQKCLESWQHYNKSTWNIRYLDSNSLKEYVDISSFSKKQITPTSLSDIIRISLLRKYGGVWVDSTTLCTQKLDNWLWEYASQGFFAFDRPTKDRMIASWFLAADKDNSIIAKWHQAVMDYWNDHIETDNYFWFHKLFNDLYTANSDFANAWDLVPKMNVVASTQIQRIGFLRFCDDKIKDKINWWTPIFKLSYKYNQQAELTGTVLNYILNSYKGRNAFQSKPEQKLQSAIN